MFTPVDPAIKEKVISAYLTGKGRNQITRELHEQGVRVSHGSISNIIGAYKRKHEQPLQSDRNDHSGIEQANITPKDGGPLLNLNEDIDSTNVNMNNFEQKYFVQKQEQEDIDFADTPYPEDEKFDGLEGERYFTYNINQDPNIEPNTNDKHINQNVTTEDETIEEEEREFRQSRPQLRSSLPNSKNPPVEMDWDSDEIWKRRFLRIVFKDKRERRQELQILEQEKEQLGIEKHNLAQVMQSIEQRNNDLKAPEARQLQEMKLTLEDALPWIETVRELAQMQNTDIKTAARYVAQEIRRLRQLGGLQRSIEQARGELKMLNITITQKQEAVTVLIDLLNRGVTESQIVQLINFAGEWNKYWQSSKTNVNGNLQQPANGSNNPGSSDGNFSVNDLIRLNLLKSTTTNMLNRMETSCSLQ
jgi:hypothetical protein